MQEKYWEAGLKYTCGAFIAVLALYLGFTLSFWYGAECVLNTSKCPQSISTRAYTAGTIVKIFYSLFLPAISLNQLTPSLQKIAEGKAAASRIFHLIDREPKVKSREDAIIPDEFKGVFFFNNVTFGYPKDRKTKILKNLTMTIDGKHSAIVGKSGCGKSTIFQLIMRFYDPDSGAIYLDGVDLRYLNLDWLRSQIGYVKQEPILFAASIK